MLEEKTRCITHQIFNRKSSDFQWKVFNFSSIAELNQLEKGNYNLILDRFNKIQ